METTHSLWNLIEEEGVALKNNKEILFEISTDNEDGTYPLIMHYVTFANKIDKEGTSAWLNRMGGKKKLNFKYLDGVTIIRDAEYESQAKLVFDSPIAIIMGYVGEEPIVTKVTQISGEFCHEWFWTQNPRQNKIANGFEISFKIEKLLV